MSQNFLPIDNIKLFTLISLLFFLPSFSALEQIELSNEVFHDLSTAKNDIYKFQLELNTDIQDYLKIEVEDSLPSDILTAYVISFYKNENFENRVQLSQNYGKKTIMILTKEQLKDKINYISIQCSNYPCYYNINFEMENSLENMPFSLNSQYTYYVSEGNQIMEFYFSNELPNSTDYISFSATGSKNIKTKFNNNNYDEKAETLEIYNIKAEKISSNIPFRVEGEIGDLITVSAYTFDEKAIATFSLELNYPKITGFIKKNSKHEKFCYPMILTNDTNLKNGDSYYFIGEFFNDIAELTYLDEKKKLLSETDLVTTGSITKYFDYFSMKGFHVCVGFPTRKIENYNVNEVIFSLQVTNSKYLQLKTPIYHPQNLGKIYSRILSSAEVVIFSGMTAPNNSKKLKYSLITIIGFPDMFFDTCKTYPFCEYNESSIKNITDPHNINGISSYSVDVNHSMNAINEIQNVIIVNCTEGGLKNKEGKQDQSELNTKICEFNTIIYSNEDFLKLKEGQIYTQYILENDIDKYKISFKEQNNILKIYIDLIVYTGDVIFDISTTNLSTNKYNFVNKIFYSITVNKNAAENENVLNFTIKPLKTSFYSILYTLVRSDEEESLITNHLPSGINYLATIEPFIMDDNGNIYTKKNIIYKNLRINDKHPILTNFYSLDCKLDLYFVKKNNSTGDLEEMKISSKDSYYFQYILTPDDELNYFNENYTFIAKVIDSDPGIYDKKLCLLYTSSFELSQINSLVERQILVGDNIPQNIIFEKEYQTIKYIYVISNISEDIGIRFRLYDKAKYKVSVYIDRNLFGKYEIINDYQIFISNIFYPKFCPKNQPCTLILEIICDEFSIEKNPKLELAIKSIGEIISPTYLIKNKLNIDYLNGDTWNYYYTDIGQYIYGDIIINYYRASGEIYGKIVQKNNNDNINSNKKDWQNLYTFPKTQSESLPYKSYLKKLYFTEEDTKNCSVGCYLLLAVHTSIESEFLIKERQFSFSILINTQPDIEKILSQFPVIGISLDDYVIGSIIPLENKEIDIYYAVSIDYAEKIILDFQTTSARLYINVRNDYEKPTIDFFDIELNSKGESNIFEISKEDILQIAKNNKVISEDETVIKNLRLIIGVYADSKYNIFTSIYSLKVSLMQQNLNIYEINSDQQTLCNTTLFEKEKYRCLFMVKYEDVDSIYSLLLYPLFYDKSVQFEINANFIDANKYEIFNESYINSNIPIKNNSEFSTSQTKNDFLFVKLNAKYTKYLFVSIETNKITKMGLLTTFSTFDNGISPNPSSPQLYIIQNELMKFSFNGKDDLMIEITCLKGEADIYWDNDTNQIYHLRGRDDILSLTSKNNNNNDVTNLMIKNLHPAKDLILDEQKGFLFYLKFFLRSSDYNFDELTLGKSQNFAYRSADFPINLYSKIENLNNEISAFITFYTNYDNGKINVTNPFEINGFIVGKTNLTQMKKSSDLIISNPVKGNCSLNIRTCYVNLKKKDIENFSIKNDDVPMFVFQISKNINDENSRKYKNISMESTITQKNSLIPVTEKVYQFGKLFLNEEKDIYKLHTDKTAKYMRIIFSSNSDYLNTIISTKEEDTENDKSLEINKEKFNGKILYTFDCSPENNSYIYFTIKHKNPKTQNEKLTNYVFKYINANNITKFFDYKVNDTTIEYNKNGNSSIIKINSVPKSYFNKKDYNVKYLVQFIEKENLILHENFENIAVIESSNIVKEINNYIEENGTVKLTIDNIEINNYSYVGVIAQIIDGPVNEYVAYKSICNEKNNKNKASFFGSWIFVAIIGGIGLVIVIFLIILAFVYKSKDDNLLKTINKTSFQQERDSIDNDLLLSEDEELS